MKIADFDAWAREKLLFPETDPIDASLNGLQVGREDQELTKVLFAVDACMDTFKQAERENAQLVFVHHGLFWGPALPLTGVLGERVRFLMNNDISLYACHLPLDKHASLGNNARMAKIMQLDSIEPFGDYKGRKIGFKGMFPRPQSLESIVERLFGSWTTGIHALRFGKKDISSAAMISGGGTRDVSQAIAEGMDLYITGDSSHEIYHQCREAGINVLFAGHYLTEVFGVKAVEEIVRTELGLETVFADIPTGL